MGHEDIAMEYYVAENQRPLDKCLKDIASCDLYIGIFTQRYGYIPPEQQKSITELEYRTACDKGKDRLIFLLDEEASWPTKFVDKGKDAEKISSLRNELSQENLVSFFNSPHELKSLIATAVHNWEKKDEENQDEEIFKPMESFVQDALKFKEKEKHYKQTTSCSPEEIFKPMESFVQDALKFKEKEKHYEQTIYCSPEEKDEFGTPKIVVVGCGGGGNSTINRLYNIGIAGADTVAINTDKKHLDITQADKKILIGKLITRGLGAGGFPEVGRRAAELARGTIEEVLKDANLVFVTAGMGGGTGTGIAPVVAQIAKDQGAIVIGMVTCPFKVERSRLFKAGEGLYELGKAANTVIVIDNNRFLDYVPNLPIDQVFSVINQLISETVKGITETITQPSMMNFDYADIRAIMYNGGLAILLVGEAKGQDKAKKGRKRLLAPHNRRN
jgi:cell division protein FtsZ